MQTPPHPRVSQGAELTLGRCRVTRGTYINEEVGQQTLGDVARLRCALGRPLLLLLVCGWLLVWCGGLGLRLGCVVELVDQVILAQHTVVDQLDRLPLQVLGELQQDGPHSKQVSH